MDKGYRPYAEIMCLHHIYQMYSMVWLLTSGIFYIYDTITLTIIYTVSLIFLPAVWRSSYGVHFSRRKNASLLHVSWCKLIHVLCYVCCKWKCFWVFPLNVVGSVGELWYTIAREAHQLSVYCIFIAYKDYWYSPHIFFFIRLKACFRATIMTLGWLSYDYIHFTECSLWPHNYNSKTSILFEM